MQYNLCIVAIRVVLVDYWGCGQRGTREMSCWREWSISLGILGQVCYALISSLSRIGESDYPGNAMPRSYLRVEPNSGPCAWFSKQSRVRFGLNSH
jgi:hypothetical protein